MGRSRATAKQAGATFERQVADHLRDNLDDRIDRRVKTGAKDCGDIAAVRDRDGNRVVVETKNYGGRLLPAEWIREAQTERDNDGAVIGVVVAKRNRVTDPGQQWCLMTVDDLIHLLKEKK